ncbi:Zn-dependent protease (includes SpoIVFB) [Haladaptatus litoreus]|uniref:Zinc metalloprotease n=1 Tax=Haladaptatus litoreus TaxID=553468 RepID=A0A1N7BLP2_9EURY|nr:site-2 protease family protein [Haladaptatus litoreus]SIR52166.1 Zn-dependent protease (includes SpoIVFB) [Haladaptatus litoreus]
MRGFRLGSVWGAPVRIDISLLLALPVLGWWIQRGVSVRAWIDVLTAISPHTLAYSSIGTGVTPWLIGVTVFFGFSASLFVHELARVWVARRNGIEVRYVLLWIFGGLSQFDYESSYFEHETKIALAGLLASALLTGFFTAVLWALPGTTPEFVAEFGLLAMFNGVVLLVNLLPIFPFDGALLLRSLLVRIRSPQTATRAVSLLGQVVVIGILFYAAVILGNVLLGLVAVFFYFSAVSEHQLVTNQLFLADMPVSEFVRGKEDCIPSKTPVEEFFADEQPNFDEEDEYPVCDSDGKPVGVLTTSAIQSWKERARPANTATVGELASEDFVSVSPDENAFDVYLFLRERTKYVLVSYPGSVAVLTKPDFLTMLETRQQIAGVRPTSWP